MIKSTTASGTGQVRSPNKFSFYLPRVIQFVINVSEEKNNNLLYNAFSNMQHQTQRASPRFCPVTFVDTVARTQTTIAQVTATFIFQKLYKKGQNFLRVLLTLELPQISYEKIFCFVCMAQVLITKCVAKS